MVTDARHAGLDCRGGFHPAVDDQVPEIGTGRRPGTLVLLGFAGSSQWPSFEASEEFRDGLGDPLDRWSRRVIDGLAARFGAGSAYPFGGPPWWPFQRWAMKAEGLRASPLGILMHPQFGLWHSYRGALLFAERIELPAPGLSPHPCDTCLTKPCLHTCPVNAVHPDRYEAGRCRDFVRSAQGSDCRQSGCLARRACPVGAEHRQGVREAAFHMAAFVR
ncbi:MAG: 4Fe-4S dicluster domain-containing protein [Proteobacteria bacterium]|nr:4Fe-4S dicluster domain-containing protein [Pseudomonadota bacterium]